MGVNSTNMRCFWFGANGSIPSGWTRDTAFDDKFLQGDDSGFTGSSNGGSSSHTHTADAHTHTGNSHTHLFSGFVSPQFDPNVQVKDGGEFGGNRRVKAGPPIGQHSHVSKTSASKTISYQTTVITVGNDSTLPPSVRAIVIKPDDSDQDIPDDCVCYTDETTLPTGFVKTDGAGGITPDLDDQFIIGADTGNDGDTTGEGSTTHTHSPTNHTHTPNSHLHAAVLSGTGTPSWGTNTGTPSTAVATLTHHRVTLNSASTSLSSDAVVVASAGTEPAHVKVLGIQNTSGSATTPIGVILPYVGAASGIPSNWELCDGNDDTPNMIDKQIKITTANGEIDDTGGSNTHGHTTTSHGHTHSGSHDHTGGDKVFGFISSKTGSPSIGILVTSPSHSHTWSVTNVTPTLQNETVTMSNTDDIRLPYRLVVFAKKISEPLAALKDVILSRGIIPFSR